jgi:tRNA A37 threonylcarbamoyladenosine biosynthesis protein TsaE
MSINKHFKDYTLSIDQQKAVNRIGLFLEDQGSIFLLKGYAGSGKTTLLKGIIKYLEDEKRDFAVMAPTGRAAKILRDKTGHGSTIHRGIYKLDELEAIQADAEDEAEQSFHYHFPIQSINNIDRIIIVDEASMISNNKSSQELFSYGTDVLFQDLLTYANIKTTNTKIIFVGDPAQLPPVGDNNSMAFNKDYYRSMDISFEEVEMQQIFRQDDESGLILKNATKFRDLLKETKRNELSFEFDDHSMIQMSPVDVTTKYVELFPVPEIGNGVIINYSNQQAYTYNVSVREKLFPDSPNIVPGDIVMLNNNNYSHYGTELFNGDMAKVLEVSPEIETISAPVMVTIGGKKVREIVTLTLRDIKIRLNSSESEIKCKIFDNLLNSPQRDLKVKELKALYINFVMRFNEQQKKNKEAGRPSFKVGSEEFKKALQLDPYQNALRIKYGYAITCHKSQGGEWDTVFVDYTGRVGLYDNALRWAYTATTRAIKVCYAINPPCFSAFSQLSFNSITRVNNGPSNALFLDNIPLSPFHNTSQHKCKSQKYWEVSSKIEISQYSIIRVESRDYLERYVFQDGATEIVLDAIHNGAGFFKDFTTTNPTGKELMDMLNTASESVIFLDYVPTSDPLTKLYSVMQNYCSELQVAITNIIEAGANYYVTYCLKTSGMFSYIQFYYKSNGQFTSALPKSDIGNEDVKLVQLIEKLTNHAI